MSPSPNISRTGSVSPTMLSDAPVEARVRPVVMTRASTPSFPAMESASAEHDGNMHDDHFEILAEPLQLPSLTPAVSDKTQHHPTWSMWDWWFDETKHHTKYAANSGTKSANGNWLESLKPVGTFDTVEGYWGIVNNLQEPTSLFVGHNHHLFRHNIAPMWEHECNRRGGKWVAVVEVGTSAGKAIDVNAMWRRLGCAAIGECFPGKEEEVCGIILSKRKATTYRFSVWTRTGDDEALQRAIGKYLKNDVLQLDPAAEVHFIKHTTSMKEGSAAWAKDYVV